MIIKYAHINDHVKITECMHGDIVILNLQSNKYHIIRSTPPGSLEQLLIFPVSHSKQNEQFAGALDSIGAIIYKSSAAGDLHRFSTPSYVGQVDPVWNPPRHGPSISGRWMLAEALYEILHATYLIKRRGMLGIKRASTRFRAAGVCRLELRHVENTIIPALTKMFAFDFSNNKCLTYSIALYSLLRRRGGDAKIVIGVRTRPFISHAWIELDGAVVADERDLRNRMSTIMEIR